MDIQALTTLCEATLLVAQSTTLESALQQIVDTARGLVDASFAALTIPHEGLGYEHAPAAFVFSGISAETAATINHPPLNVGLLGEIMRENKAVRLDNLHHDPRAIGFPAGHPPMESLLGVPIRSGEQVLGNLYLANKKHADAFSATDQTLLEMFAAHAAVALQNARLIERIEELAVLAERQRVGITLHDNVIQSLFAAGMSLEAVQIVAETCDASAEIMPPLNGAIGMIRNVIQDVRNYITDLKPRRYSGDLVQSVSQLVREFQMNSAEQVNLQIENEPHLQTIPATIGRAIFLTLQEALANVARFAAAHSTEVRLSAKEDQIELTVSDNGKGFEPDETTWQVGHGLANMRRRAQQLGGTFTLDAAAGKGTSITMQLQL